MNIREDIAKAVDTLSDEMLIQEPEEVEPSEAEVKTIARGKAEIARGEVVRWGDIKKNVL